MLFETERVCSFILESYIKISEDSFHIVVKSQNIVTLKQMKKET